MEGGESANKKASTALSMYPSYAVFTLHATPFASSFTLPGSLRRPDILHGLRQADGWWTGCNQTNGLFGDFPANYVESVDVTEVQRQSDPSLDPFL